jgi:hypothetical protein
MRNAVAATIFICLALGGVINPYAYGAVLVIFLLVNLPVLLCGLVAFLYRRPADPVIGSGILPADQMHAATIARALMPNVHELVDPAETVAHYRRQTERLQALKEKLDAQTALAEAVIRNHRARNYFNPHD